MFNPKNYSDSGLKFHIKTRCKQIYQLKKELGLALEEKEEYMVFAEDLGYPDVAKTLIKWKTKLKET